MGWNPKFLGVKIHISSINHFWKFHIINILYEIIPNDGPEALLSEANSKGDLVDNNNCSLDIGSGDAPSNIGIPVVEVAFVDSPEKKIH